MKHEIVAVPTVILFKAGKAVDRYGWSLFAYIVGTTSMITSLK